MKPPTVYLAGPINGCTDDEANGWRESFMTRLPTYGFLDPMERDYRGREDECINEIVELDKSDINDCDIFLAYHWKSSDGTSMEIHYAWELRQKQSESPLVLVVIPEGQRISPWVRYHSDKIIPTLEDGVGWIKLWVAENWY